MPTSPTVNAAYRLATPEGTAATETLERVQDGWGVCTVASERKCASRHEGERYGMIFYVRARAGGQTRSSDHPSPGLGAARSAAQVRFSSDQVLLSGCPMWFHLDRQGLQLASAYSLSGHEAGAVQGKAPLNWLDKTHHGAHFIAIATGASRRLWCLTVFTDHSWLRLEGTLKT